MIGGSPAYAEKGTRSCDAVVELAEVEFDTTMIVSAALNYENRRCKFYIAPPPHAAADTAIGALTEYANAIRDSTPGEFLAVMKGPNFVKLLTEALLVPVYDKEFFQEAASVDALAKLIEASSEELIECSLNAFANNVEFEPREEGVSCGMFKEGGTRFVVQASAKPLSVELSIPLS